MFALGVRAKAPCLRLHPECDLSDPTAQGRSPDARKCCARERKTQNAGKDLSRRGLLTPVSRLVRGKERNSPRRSQLDSRFVERGTLQLQRLRRAAVIAFIPWGTRTEPKPLTDPAP